MATTISVNGLDGATLARSTGLTNGLEQGQVESSALVLHRHDSAITRHGSPGVIARQAVSGGPAGTLAIQLFESQTAQGAIHVRVLESTQAHHLPPATEVPVGRDLRVTAIGGIGESGHKGGNGQDGMDGVDGSDASRGSDATSGTDAGDGGAAGRGSNGAHGGAGGDIHVIMDQNSTHLIMAVSWDLKGGTGGRAGQHGAPGKGGKGGTGGQGWKWEELVGYKYFCTSSCVGQSQQPSTSTDLVRLGSRIHASSTAITAPIIGSLLVSGNNLQAAIVQARRRYQALERSRPDPGACKCGGGEGTCAGCDMKPIIKTFKRAPGLAGRDGESGAAITAPLVKGRKGPDGSATIVVQQADGSTLQYSTPWNLELIDFEVEDSNNDGICEPGEYLHIRRVRVRNAGGMPSPTCPIAITVAELSDDFERCDDADGGVAFLPPSIPAAGEATMEGSVRVRIKPNIRPVIAGTRWEDKGWIQIRGDVPWVQRRLPSSTFELRKEVKISFPCGFGDFKQLNTVAQGTTSMVTYRIQNLGNQGIGEPGAPPHLEPRALEVSVTMPRSFGRLVSNSSDEETPAAIPVPYVRGRDGISMEQQFRILTTAKLHATFDIIFDLYIEAPEQTQWDRTELVHIDRRVVPMQVSSVYVRQPDARFLLLTNPHTEERQARAITEFIRNSLFMEVDQCNVQQNGGLMYADEDDIETPILEAYHSKTIIVLNDSFGFFGNGQRTSLQLCESEWIHTLAKNQSSALMVGTRDDEELRQHVRQAVFPFPFQTDIALRHVKQSHIFESPEQMLESIYQEKRLGVSPMRLSAVVAHAKWYRCNPLKPLKDEAAAKALAKYLRERLPNERFIVSHNDAGHTLVLTGLEHRHSITSLESNITLQPTSPSNPTLTRLDRFTKYTIISSIPFPQRLDILWNNIYENPSITSAIRLSLTADLFRQMDGLQTSKYRNLLRPSKNNQLYNTELILKTHLSFLHQFFQHDRADHATLPADPIQEVLAYILAYSSHMPRHRNLKDIIISLFRAHPSTSLLLNLEDFKASVAKCRPEALIEEISQLTSTTPLTLMKGSVGASDVVRRTEYWEPRRWDEGVRNVRAQKERVREDAVRAKRVMGRMVVCAGAGAGAEDGGEREDDGEGVREGDAAELSV